MDNICNSRVRGWPIATGTSLSFFRPLASSRWRENKTRPRRDAEMFAEPSAWLHARRASIGTAASSSRSLDSFHSFLSISRPRHPFCPCSVDLSATTFEETAREWNSCSSGKKSTTAVLRSKPPDDFTRSFERSFVPPSKFPGLRPKFQALSVLGESCAKRWFDDEGNETRIYRWRKKKKKKEHAEIRKGRNEETTEGEPAKAKGARNPARLSPRYDTNNKNHKHSDRWLSPSARIFEALSFVEMRIVS